MFLLTVLLLMLELGVNSGLNKIRSLINALTIKHSNVPRLLLVRVMMLFLEEPAFLFDGCFPGHTCLLDKLIRHGKLLLRTLVLGCSGSIDQTFAVELLSVV